MRPDDRTLTRALLVASLAHGLVWALVHGATARSPDPRRTSPPPAEEDVVQTFEWEPPPPPPSGLRGSAPASLGRRAAAARAPRATRAVGARAPAPRDANEPPPRGDPAGDDWDAPDVPGPRAPSDLEGPSLSTFVDLAGPPPPAPTAPPPTRHIDGVAAGSAISAVSRERGRSLGLVAPQEAAVARAVELAGRSTPVPSGTRFSVTVELDRGGHVVGATVHGDSVGDRFWAGTLAEVRASLSAEPVRLGDEERQRGARVIVEATVLHVLPSGGVKAITAGECPEMPLVGGETPGSFFAFGGTPYLQPGRGLCPLFDTGDLGAHRVITVRTKTRTEHDGGDAPPPMDAFPKPRKKPALPSLRVLLAKLLSG
jgi:hypothetical protein